MDKFFLKIHSANLFQSTTDMQGMPYYTQEKMHDQTVASMDFSYYMLKASFSSQIVFEILTFKNLLNLIS